MKNIVPVLWFGKDGEKAAEFYTMIFPNSKINEVIYGPDEDFLSLYFDMGGVDFGIINGGEDFEKNPSISFTVYIEAKEKVDEIWNRLLKNGKVLMPLQKYDFTDYYGWVQDQFGISWQLVLGKSEPVVVPSFLFTKEHYHQAENAIEKYTSTFGGSSIHELFYYGNEQTANHKDALMYGSFNLRNQKFIAMDSALDHDYTFNEGISLMVLCDTQEEIDYLWDNLSVVPEAEKWGWLKDEFGVSWQIVPRVLIKYIGDRDKKKVERVISTFPSMKKLEIAKIQKAYNGEG